MTQATLRSLCIIGLSAACVGVQAAPAINSASGTASGGSTISVSGSGFGSSGPNIVLFDDFEGGTAGQPIDMAAVDGRWSGTGGSTPVDSSQARTGRTGFLGYDTSDGHNRQLRLSLGGDQTEIFYSFWVRIPDYTAFPGNASDVGVLQRQLLEADPADGRADAYGTTVSTCVSRHIPAAVFCRSRAMTTTSSALATTGGRGTPGCAFRSGCVAAQAWWAPIPAPFFSRR